LRADISVQWARWFVESVSDPVKYTHLEAAYPRIYGDVFAIVRKWFSDATFDEQRLLASSIASAVHGFVRRLQASRQRLPLSASERRLHLDLAGNPPRCWICGVPFDDQAIDKYLARDGRELPLPHLVDVLKPRGLSSQDLRIEVDHQMPLAQGGEGGENLSLSCGWCNRHKSERTSIYDVEGLVRSSGPNNFDIRSLPSPFWTVRLLALVGTCEHQDGCTASTNQSYLTVTPMNVLGSMNPTNLRVTCYEHDPLKEIRLQSRRSVEKLWSGSPRG